MNAYAKYLNKNNKCMKLLVYDTKFKKNIMKYGEKNIFPEKFDNQPVYNDKYIKTKIHLYNTNFYGNKTPI